MMKLLAILLVSSAFVCHSAASPSISWKQCLRQPDAWYGSDEAIAIADRVLLYQTDSGGWPKNTDFAAPLTAEERGTIRDQQSDRRRASIDNGATVTPLRFLARVIRETGHARYVESFRRGLRFLLDSQYENGGWPQYPDREGYHAYITYNDNGMIGVLNLLREIVREPEAYPLVSDEMRRELNTAIRKGINCILNTQIVVDGRKTAWCAQHHHETLEPAPARSYEKRSISGYESVGIVRFLMGIRNPDDRVHHAIKSAVQWFEEAAVHGIREDRVDRPGLPRGYDKLVIQDEDAPRMWARFHEIGTNRPIFSGRDGIIQYALADIEYERRVGYSWYTRSPETLLKHDYPQWRARVKKEGSIREWSGSLLTGSPLVSTYECTGTVWGILNNDYRKESESTISARLTTVSGKFRTCGR